IEDLGVSSIVVTSNPGCLAAAAAELSLTSNLQVGAVKQALFRSRMFALGISSLCEVDGSNRGGDAISDG
ncbi:hypothetical protein Tco_0562851, partial [Tanacetum coccineum]